MENLSAEEKKVLLKKFIYDVRNDQRLTEWEKEFLLSIESQMEFKEISEKQLAIIENIKKKCKRSL